MNQQNQQITENGLLQLTLTALKPWTTEEITWMVNNQIIPKIDQYNHLIRPVVRNALKFAFIKYEKDIKLHYLDEGINLYRKDLIPILSSRSGLIWKKALIQKIKQWGKTL